MSNSAIIQSNILGHRLCNKQCRANFLEQILFHLTVGKSSIPIEMKSQIAVQEKAWTLELEKLNSEIAQIEESLEVLMTSK